MSQRPGFGGPSGVARDRPEIEAGKSSGMAALSKSERNELLELRERQEGSFLVGESTEPVDELRIRRRHQNSTLRPGRAIDRAAESDDPRLRAAGIGATGGVLGGLVFSMAVGAEPVAPAVVGGVVGGVSGFGLRHYELNQ